MHYIILYFWLMLISLLFSYEKGFLLGLGIDEMLAHFILCGEATLVIFFMLRKDK